MSIRPLRPYTDKQFAYIALAQEELPQVLPGVDWESHVWNVRSLNNGGSRTIANVYFTKPGSQTEPLPPCFVDLAKAVVLLERRGVSNMQMRLEGLRHLWLAIENRLGKEAPTLFTWTGLLPIDLEMTERLMLERKLSSGAVYKYCGVLQGLIEKLAARDVPAVRPNFVTPRQESRDRYTLQDEEDRERLMISDEALQALGAIYLTYGQDTGDRLLGCLCALQLASGLRIVEILTLRVDCLKVTTERIMMPSGRTEEREMTALFRFKAKSKRKGGKGKPSYEPIYLTPAQASLANEAFEEVLRITTPFRARAKAIEKLDGHCPLPPSPEGEEYLPFDELSRDQLANLLGLTQPASLNKVPKSQLPRQGGGKGPDGRNLPFTYQAADVEIYLKSRQPDLVVLKNDGSGRPQLLSDTLLIAPVNLFHRQRGVNPLIIDRIRHEHVDLWLGGRTGKSAVKSVFERMEEEHGVRMREADGSPIRLNSHQFRHWVTTKAVEAGASDTVISRWQGREHDGDLSAYKHLTREQKLSELKSALTAGRLKGDFAKVYFALRSDVRDIWLEDQLQAVHVTQLGLCIHDFTISPCPHAVNCLRGCSDYVFDPRDQKARVQLVQLRGRTKQSLDQAVAQAALDEDDLAEQWVEDHENTVRNIEEVLGSDKKTEAFRPFKDRDSRFQPFGDAETIGLDELVAEL